MSSDETTKVKDLIQGIRMGMLTTADPEGGRLVSRPMAVAKIDDDGTLWFLTDDTSPKAQQVQREREVNVAFSSDTSWVSVAGQATVVEDQAKVHELWSSHAEAWFPDGPDAPEVAALRVDPDTAEYWDAPGKARMALSYAKARATGNQPEAGEHGSADF